MILYDPRNPRDLIELRVPLMKMESIVIQFAMVRPSGSSHPDGVIDNDNINDKFRVGFT